jgi:ASCH domain.
MITISIKQPWASLIVHGIKDIENRTWPLPKKHIGKRVLIHASSKPYKDGLGVLNPQQICEIDNWFKNSKLIPDLGAIIGSVELVGYEINHPSIWAEKSEGVFVGNTFVHKEGIKPIYNWILANPILLPEPIPAKGKLNFWDFHQ